MAQFCTRCGQRNDSEAAFCENCGAAMARGQQGAAAGKLPRPAALQSDPPPYRPSPRMAMLVGGGVALVAVIAVAAFIALRAPSPSHDRLVTASRQALQAMDHARVTRSLCIANTDYRISPFNANAWDQGTLRWMNALVAAGLYSGPTPVQGGGFMPTQLMQYVPTAELAKYRDGSRLCVARNVEIADVRDIGKPSEGPRPLVSATVVLRASDAAPWLARPEIREVVLPQLPGWAWVEGRLQRTSTDTFALADGKWTVADAVPVPSTRDTRPGATARTEPSSHWWSGLFSAFSGNPLRGTWEALPTSVMGIEIPVNLAARMTFTGDTLETGGVSMRVRYDVDGKRVRVTPDGQAQALLFVVDGDTMLFEATGLRYKRVK